MDHHNVIIIVQTYWLLDLKFLKGSL